jgi:hypothetical protein
VDTSPETQGHASAIAFANSAVCLPTSASATSQAPAGLGVATEFVADRSAGTPMICTYGHRVVMHGCDRVRTSPDTSKSL